MKRTSRSQRGFFLPSGHLTEEAVGLCVDALKLERYDEVPTDIRAHLEDCQACRGNVSGVFALLADQKYDGNQAHPYLDARSRFARGAWYKIAAVLVVLVGIGALVALYLSNRPAGLQRENQALVPGQDSSSGRSSPENPLTGREDHARTLASRLEPNAELEALVDARMRSPGVKVLRPVIGGMISGSVMFDWSGGPAGKYTVTIYDNSRTIVLRLTVDRTSLKVDQGLQPGLYYWKLESNDELLYFGKFIVQ